MSTLNVGDNFIIQDASVSGLYQNWEVISVTQFGTYISISVDNPALSYTNSFIGGDPVLLLLNLVGPAGPTGPTGSTGPTGTFSPLGTNYGDYVYWNTNTLPAA